MISWRSGWYSERSSRVDAEGQEIDDTHEAASAPAWMRIAVIVTSGETLWAGAETQNETPGYTLRLAPSWTIAACTAAAAVLRSAMVSPGVLTYS